MSEIVNLGSHAALAVWVGVLIWRLRSAEKMHRVLMDRMNEQYDRLDGSLFIVHTARQKLEERVWNLEHRPNMGPYR